MDVIQDSLEKAFSDAMNIPFVWEDEPRTCLQKLYGVLSFGQSITIGKDYSRYVFNNIDVTLNTYGHREITVTVQAFSRKAKGEHSSYKIAQSLLSQSPKVTKLKIGRRAKEEKIRESFKAIYDADSDFYGLLLADPTLKDITDIA